MVNRLQICSVCGRSINSPVRMSKHLGCTEKPAAPKSHPKNPSDGWWERFIGPGAPLDTDRTAHQRDLQQESRERWRKIEKAVAKRAKKKRAAN